ncbi:MAG: hypothetical protein ACIALR_08545 [Blastopirellula sp. JB062]
MSSKPYYPSRLAILGDCVSAYATSWAAWRTCGSRESMPALK